MAKQNTSPKTTPAPEKKPFAIDKQNYKYMAIGLGLIVLGFLFMLGGGSNDPNVFNEKIFSFTRITLAPLLVIAGFAVETYAIILKPKAAKEPEQLKK